MIEEAAFRGYMLSVVQRRHGWVVGVISVAFLFYVVHRTHAYAVWGFLPFFLAYSFLHGLLVYLTGSVLPSVVIHALGDALILPIQYGVVANPLGDSVGLHVAAVGGLGIASLLALWRLAGHIGSSRHAELPPRAPTSRLLA